MSVLFCTFANLRNIIDMNHIADFLQSSDMFSLPIVCILIVVGSIVGFINTISGGATAISYALFMAMGMPITVANGTTRLGVTMQFATTSVIFSKKGILNKYDAIQVGVPVALGAVGGAQVASSISPHIFELILACFLIIMLLLLVFDAKRFLYQQISSTSQKISFWKFMLFVAIGFYGGFTHVGVGLMILFASVLILKTDLLHANGIKQLAVVLYTPLALITFALNGQVNWPVAIIYGIGNVIGGYIGSKKAISWGTNFVRWFTIVIVFVFASFLIIKNI